MKNLVEKAKNVGFISTVVGNVIDTDSPGMKYLWMREFEFWLRTNKGFCFGMDYAEVEDSPEHGLKDGDRIWVFLVSKTEELAVVDRVFDKEHDVALKKALEKTIDILKVVKAVEELKN